MINTSSNRNLQRSITSTHQKLGFGGMATYAIEEIDGESYYSRLSLVDIDSKLYKFQDAIRAYCSPIKETRWTQYLNQMWHESKRKIHCKTMDMLENFEIKEDAPRYKERAFFFALPYQGRA